MAPTRRRFLRAAAAAICTPAALAADAPAITILDTHQHLWDLNQFHLPWLENAGPLLKRNYLMADYLKAIEGLNVSRAVYMEVEVAADERDREANWIMELCEKKAGPTVAAVIGGRPEAEGFRAYVTRFKGSRYVKGVRSPYAKGAASNRKFVDGVKLLGDLGMSYDLLADAGQLDETVKLVEACPDTRFILDHCGNAGTMMYLKADESDAAKERLHKWELGIAGLAARKNVVCKISGVAEAGEPGDATAAKVAPVVSRCLDGFGEDRVMFASNWPVVLKALTLRQWVDVLKQITATRGERYQRKLFGENAKRFYGLGD